MLFIVSNVKFILDNLKLYLDPIIFYKMTTYDTNIKNVIDYRWNLDEKISLRSGNKFVVRIEDDTSVYGRFSVFFAEKYMKQNEGKFVNVREPRYNTGVIKKLEYGVPVEQMIEIDFEEHKITCYIAITGKLVNRITCEMIVATPNEDVFNRLMEQVNVQKNIKSVFSWDVKCSSWAFRSNLNQRDQNSLILNKDLKTTFINDINNFIKNKQKYEKRGVPYKRNYLFVGPPGTGKTSLVNITALMTDRNVYIVSLDSQMNDSEIQKAYGSLHRSGSDSQSIMLIEDIDCLYTNRENSSNTFVNFSALINILDGVQFSSGLITIMTTNHKEKLDKALQRPGRIDRIVEFGYITKEQIFEFFKSYEVEFSKEVTNDFISRCNTYKLTPAYVSGFLFRHEISDVTLNDSNCIDLFQKYIDENLESTSNDEHKKMFI